MADRGTAEVTGDRAALAETLREMSRRMVGDTGREGRNYEGIQGTAGDDKQAGRRKGQGGKKEEATYGGGYGISHTGFLSRRDSSGAAFLTERLRADVGRGALSSYAGGGTVLESSTGQSRNQSSALPTKPSTAYSVI